MKDEKSGTRTDLEREFASTTTLHGIGRVIDSPRVPLKLLWLSILLMCLGVCIWQITDRFQRYFKYEANTAVSVEYVGDLNFPAVTICNFNRYRKSALTEADRESLQIALQYTEYDYDSYDDGDPELLMPEEPANFSFTEFTLRTGFILDSKTLMDCEWRGRKSSCSADNFTHVFTSFGNCWTFNAGDDEDGKSVKILNQIQTGSGNGLRMIIDIQQIEYTEIINNGNLEAGLKVLIHDQETPPSVDSEGLAIAPGVHAFIGVRKIEYNNLEDPFGDCDKSKSLEHYDKYTLEGCNIECRAKNILERCGCRLVRHPGHEAECSPLNVTRCANPVLAELKSGTITGCECPVPCNYTEFRTSLSLAALPSNNLIEDMWENYAPEYLGNFSVEEGGKYIRENWILLDIYYETLNFEKYKQNEAITPSALISDIGGQLGLFLGASFITMAEILHYLGRKIGRCVTGFSQRDVVRPKKEEALGIQDLSSTDKA